MLRRLSLIALALAPLMLAACNKPSPPARDPDSGTYYSVELPGGRALLTPAEVRSKSREAYIRSAYPDKREEAIQTFRAIVAATPPGTGEHDEAARVLKSLTSP